MRALKFFFLGRLVSEKLLLTTFLAIAGAIWATSFVDRVSTWARHHQGARKELEFQAMLMDRASKVEEDARRAVSTLDPSRTFNASRLLGEVDAIARRVGVQQKFNQSDQRTAASSEFSVHSLQCTIRKIDYETLVRFYREILKRSPYIAVERPFTIQVDPADPSLVGAQFRVSSVEVVRQP